MAEVTPPGIPAEEFPHAEEYQGEDKQVLPEWWEVPGALKDVATNAGWQKKSEPKSSAS